MNLYRWLNHRHSEKMWASIKKSIKDYESGVKMSSVEDVTAYFDARAEARAQAPWYKKLYRNLHYNLFGIEGWLSYKLNPRIIINHMVWARQRAKNGWCDRDCWSIDYYITKVLAGMLLRLSEHHMAYPGTAPFETPEQWHDHLADLSARMRAWADDDTPENYEVTQTAMREFTEKLGWYWD